MRFIDDLTPFQLDGGDTDTLWTQHMTACLTVATYDPDSGKRTLIHIQGGYWERDQTFFETMALNLGPNSVIIIVSGAEESQEALNNYMAKYKQELDVAMFMEGKDHSNLTYLTYWSKPHVTGRAGTATFVFKGDGEYGHINPALPPEPTAQPISTGHALPAVAAPTSSTSRAGAGLNPLSQSLTHLVVGVATLKPPQGR